MIVLDGKIAAQAVKDKLKAQVANFTANGHRPPKLAAILVGSNGASETYVASKVKNCAETGFESLLIRLDASVDEATLLQTIEKLNHDHTVDGILVQLPLPKHISEQKVIETIHPAKDVDGFHPVNAGKLVQGLPGFIPATPYGIMLLLEHFHIQTKGKHAVVMGRSNIVGRPMSILLSSNIPYGNCTVTIAHSQTQNLKAICLQADILVAALGKPEFVTADMVKSGAIVIDVGITRVEDATAKKGFRIKGDVAFNEVAPKTTAITPVPGGVGLMTIAGLLTNTLQAYLNNVTA
ncbi:MAG: bifunctional 5,10-methylene-tetrahydrofolate dehydrogenase/5,10-methylene-tetrahydrofolate cyclohydrolase [Hydrotalea flava]|uniref:bifunctional 5,10-methylenetetrahydrofolate dehydrogenase/5,10-methenyltetrahydrofolate cyclohydrolase n=1 Tax=Hydrotalea TaxID=1004300 RepID=UPI000942FA17|nr:MULTISPECIES: bifunctional 5,10-methylenetetrahydrofolate dehydrogenase/5,10-methenyltetrahydrofolate cyclohydrolase [Hydrotalea]NIM36484.1 bifunctional 5,10-methylene-tetrahydrofolate dehydrogenase/5,10-methylene-tetrahydrofolate cyclohydrolase [Hydrotalea flava]NIM39343.1 bifunctional 5,10-methylene-tetrahydrofolate dehydrogenase/5,10-methylene-tetrahydrofolate cyclohydrolase [Hydrotalea flava]NIN04532.1 bifunctional 5,10-methylene-tetrahydrofolate dehydrogenase/5,10-methylene-tetrahydrofol